MIRHTLLISMYEPKKKLKNRLILVFVICFFFFSKTLSLTPVKIVLLNKQKSSSKTSKNRPLNPIEINGKTQTY